MGAGLNELKLRIVEMYHNRAVTYMPEPHDGEIRQQTMNESLCLRRVAAKAENSMILSFAINMIIRRLWQIIYY